MKGEVTVQVYLSYLVIDHATETDESVGGSKGDEKLNWDSH